MILPLPVYLLVITRRTLYWIPMVTLIWKKIMIGWRNAQLLPSFVKRCISYRQRLIPSLMFSLMKPSMATIFVSICIWTIFQPPEQPESKPSSRSGSVFLTPKVFVGQCLDMNSTLTLAITSPSPSKRLIMANAKQKLWTSISPSSLTSVKLSKSSKANGYSKHF